MDNMRELASKYKRNYKKISKSITDGNQRHEFTFYVFIDDNLPYDISSEYNKRKRNTSRSYYQPNEIYNHVSHMPAYQYRESLERKYFQNSVNEHIFISVLIDKGILRENQVKDFKEEIKRQLDIKGKVIWGIVGFIFIALAIVGLLSGLF